MDTIYQGIKDFTDNELSAFERLVEAIEQLRKDK